MLKLHSALCDVILSLSHKEQILKAREAEHSSRILEYLCFFLQPTNYEALRRGGRVAAIHKYVQHNANIRNGRVCLALSF